MIWSGSVTAPVIYIYDAENRLVIATRPGEGGFTAHYHYDAFGRRVSKEVERPVHGRLGEVETTRINFTWQGMRLLQERHNNNSLGYTYVYSPDADYTPIAQVKQWLELEGVDDELFYYHTDLNGAPLDMTNEEGRIVWSGDYAPWGKVINQTQAFLLQHGSAPPDIWQPLRYAGQYEDEETGLHQNLYRFYAPEVGRYIQPDPIGLAGGLNLYAYGSNPANWVDPWGLSSCKLAKNMEKDGTARPKDSAAHHIVGDTSKKAAPARRVLSKHGIGVDDAVNGVFLPNRNNAGNLPGILHNGRHPNSYFETVNRLIIDADKIGGKQGVINELSRIREILSSAKHGSSWYNIL